VRLGSWLLGCSALLVACGGGGGGGPGGGAEPPAAREVVTTAYFPAEVGDRWIYEVRGDALGAINRTELARVEGPAQLGGRQAQRLSRREIDASLPDAQTYFAVEAEGVFLLPTPVADPGQVALDPYLLLPARARLGEPRQVMDSRLRSPIDLDRDGRQDELRVRIEVTVLAQEPLSTRAGSFSDALRVRTVVFQTALYSSGRAPATVTTTTSDWYGRGVGLLRRQSVTEGAGARYVDTIEILGYRVGGRASETVAPSVTLERPGPVTLPAFSVRLRASERLEIDTLRPELLELVGPDGLAIAGSWSATPTQLDFAVWPGTAPLASGAYRINLRAGATDLLGNALPATSWDFRVDADAPRLVAWSIADGSDQVPLDARFTIDFSEDISPGSVAVSLISDRGGYLDIDVSVQAGRVTVTPRQPLPGRTRHTLQIQASDAVGNFIGPNPSIDFRTDPGRFSHPVRWPVPGSTEAVAVGDLNGDGLADLAATVSVVGSVEDYRLLVLAQGPDGQLTTPPQTLALRGNLGCIPRTLALGDLNGDGRLDAAVGLGACGLEVFLQNAQGGLEPGLPVAGTDAHQIRVADMDGDGRADIVGIGFASGSATVWRQRPGGGFDATAHAVAHGGFGDLSIGDVNSDGLPDIVVASGQGTAHALAVLRQLAGGSFGAVSYHALPDGLHARAVAVGDLDGDGRHDVAFSHNAEPAVSLLRQNALGQLVAWTSLTLGHAGVGLEVADIDGDGRQDLVAASDVGFEVMRQGPAGVLLAAEFYDAVLSLGRNPQALAVGDINGDGAADLVGGGLAAVLGRNTARGPAAARPARPSVLQMLSVPAGR
jgi:hypothetical protein